MVGNAPGTPLEASTIYLLAECPVCRTRYAVAPDPVAFRQWQFFQRDGDEHLLTHICAGGLLCVRGHALDITARQAVLTQAGAWLYVEVRNAPLVLN